ncbi:MAG: helix-turn-helix domain-containing protein [Roseburia sp.]|nr:helix-turn-helix domain-containing protein [Roseburia sp.]
MDYETFFAERLASLRLEKNVSAREMSLALGQNCSYINRIENRKAFPSMQVFFYICEYLEITPKDFFNMETESPNRIKELLPLLQKLNREQLNTLTAVTKGFLSAHP